MLGRKVIHKWFMLLWCLLISEKKKMPCRKFMTGKHLNSPLCLFFICLYFFIVTQQRSGCKMTYFTHITRRVNSGTNVSIWQLHAINGYHLNITQSVQSVQCPGVCAECISSLMSHQAGSIYMYIVLQVFSFSIQHHLGFLLKVVYIEFRLFKEEVGMPFHPKLLLTRHNNH